jgi:hypothetical protein
MVENTFYMATISAFFLLSYFDVASNAVLQWV